MAHEHQHAQFVLSRVVSDLTLALVILKQGAIRNCVLAIQREFLEGDLLRDVLRLGPTDFESIVRMSKDVLQRIFASAQNGQGQRDAEL